MVKDMDSIGRHDPDIIGGGSHNAEGKPRQRSSGLDGLTPKQRAFVAARTAGAGKGEAYRMAYSPTAKDSTAHGNGAHIERSPNVANVLERVKREMEAGQIWDARRVRAWVHSQLLLEATTATSPAARVKALELLGKDAGMFTGAKDERIPISAETLRNRLKAKLLELQGNEASRLDADSTDSATDSAEPQSARDGDDTGGAPP